MRSRRQAATRRTPGQARRRRPTCTARSLCYPRLMLHARLRLLLLGGTLALGALPGCFRARYVVEQAGLQLKQIHERRKVKDVLADPATPPLLRRRLRLAMMARQFGIEELGLRGGDDFTRFVRTE